MPADDARVATYNPGTTNAYTTWTASPSSNERLPLNGASWYQAYAFCIGDDGFLPSDAERSRPPAPTARTCPP